MPEQHDNAQWFGFSRGKADGNASMRELLGGKGANLAEMCRLGLPVPPGFTLPTTSCMAFQAALKLTPAMQKAIDEGIKHIERAMPGAVFGDAQRPLLLSVRSGGRTSMPGMMDTVLNIGLNDASVRGLGEASESKRFALDAYRRLLQMYGDVVCGIERAKLDAPLEAMKHKRKVTSDAQLEADDLRALVESLKAVFMQETGKPFPQDPRTQLHAAIEAVFSSWNGDRARAYRRLHYIPDSWGTAANVQAMVFGNFGATSGTGVAFTRNPSTGADLPMGEWLANAQGEDVVAGIRTPGPLHQHDEVAGAEPSLERAQPAAYKQLRAVMTQLEKHFKDAQDIEFTVQTGTLFLLQTRTAKRTAQAALTTAVAMASEGLIDKKTAVLRVQPSDIERLMHPQLDPKAPKHTIGHGLAASPGAASGRIALDSERAESMAKEGLVILVRQETSPEDIVGMAASSGILTATGGMTSHAAVVARGMGRPCISGAQGLRIDLQARTISLTHNGTKVRLKEGDTLTLDGTSGEVFAGTLPTIPADLSGDFGILLGWADQFRRLAIRANADTPEDARRAVELGAEGIGLCRTEHMFFAPDRILAVREMILAQDPQHEQAALARLEPMQRADFVGIFEAMAGRPVTIRLLDPPLHEFLPHEEKEMRAVGQRLGMSVDQVRSAVAERAEFNPMLGHRGCRLGLSNPAIYDMQARAIIRAALDVRSRDIPVQPEIMIPLVMTASELEQLRQRIENIVEEMTRGLPPLHVAIGTMIELPRAAIMAAQIAQSADFFSFGTNDLTQTVMGMSRDDSGHFLNRYLELGILHQNPFISIDVEGVGALVEMATVRGRSTKPKLKVGICGEHGGDAASIRFFHNTGLDYVSSSPFRVPSARLAAAHAAM